MLQRILVSSMLIFTAMANQSIEGNAFTMQKTIGSYGITLRLANPAKRLISQEAFDAYAPIVRNNPNHVVQEQNAMSHKLDMLFASPDTDFWPFVEELTTANPVSLLGECDAPSCSLNRITHPQARVDAQKEIIEIIKQYNPDIAKPLTYTAFAAGSFFSDLKIIDALIQEGYRISHINLIDTLYAPYMNILNEHGNNMPWRIVDANQNKVRHAFIYTIRIAQLLEWFARTTSPISATLYANSDQYLLDCERDPALKSNIIIAFDHLLTSNNARAAALDLVDQNLPQRKQNIKFQKLFTQNKIAYEKENAVITTAFKDLCINGCHPNGIAIACFQDQDPAKLHDWVIEVSV